MLKNGSDPRELILRAKEGDSQAFALLYDEYYTPVFRYLYGRLRDKDQANDLAQTVFLKVYEAKDRLEATATPLKYFFTVARNSLIDYWRKKKTIRLDDDEDAWQNIPDKSAGQIEIVESLEMSVYVRRALDKLNEDDQEIIILKYFNGFSAREISEQIGIREDAVRQRQSRALKLLKTILNPVKYGPEEAP
ncbi:MAG: sigma-70 family RNA polymerase sigma factor [Candidatus Magasanikbacteria bacterium]|nr:sigma-70 family RNA polymerase sigma factor [Candidatus Magasanikbacteria bacterium]